MYHGVLLPTIFIVSLFVPSVVVKTILKRRDRSLKRDWNLEKFVCQLKGVPCRVDYFCRRKKDVEEWIEKGLKKQPTQLKELIQKSMLQEGFPGVGRIFDSRVPSLVVARGIKEPENCWVMPIITLVSVAINIPGVSENNKRSLLKAVDQGLKYVRFVERHLDSREVTYNARKEAQILWKSIKSKNKWYDVDLQNANAYQKLEDLAKKGEEQFKTLTRGRRRNNVQWSGKEIAWYSMYKIAKTIQIQYYDHFSHDITVFYRISEIISDTITACLTNLPRAIYVQCTKSDPLDIEEEIREAASIFGETREVMTSECLLLPIFLRLKDEMNGDDGRSYIDEWIKGAERLHPRTQDN